MAKISEIKKAKERYLQRIQLYKNGAVINADETKEDQLARIERAKKDVFFFVDYYLSEYATSDSAFFHKDLAKKVKKQKTCKIIVRWGRGLAKSVWADVVIPLWLWINDDVNYVVIVGNNLDKAKILLMDLQTEFLNPKIVHDFGEQKTFGSWENGYFRTKSGFTAKALGMGQSPRGLRKGAQRPDYIVCDDLEDKDTVKNPKRQDEVVNWIEKDLLPTMDGERRRYLHPNNNFAPRTIQEQLNIKHPNWTLHQINAYDKHYKPTWAEKYDKNYYKELEQELGLLATEAEYNNKPHIEGKVFKEEQIQWLKKYPRLNQFKVIVGFWDIAYSGNYDFNAVRIWGLKDKNFYYIDGLVRQCKMNEALEFMHHFQSNMPPTVAIHWKYESAFWNDAVKTTISDFERIKNCQLFLQKTDTPRTKKYDRIVRLQAYYQNKRVFYPENKRQDNDCITGMQQLFGIEPVYNTPDDSPDADEQAIKYLERHIRTGNSSIRTGRMKRNNKRKI